MSSLSWLSTVLYFALIFPAIAENWPCWRGPASDGSTTETGFALSWDRTNHVLWRVALPEAGNSSPIIWQNRVFVTQAVANRRTLWCLDRQSGTVRWQAGPVYDLPEETMRESNPYCSASPVTDGERVIAFFGSAGVFCFDFEGRELWRTELGKIAHPFGTASSPCLSGEMCYAYVGPGEKQSIVALEKRTGKIAWRSAALKPDARESKQVSSNGPPVGSWSTPIVIENNGRRELIMPFAFRFGGYDAKTGQLLWQESGLGLQTYVTPQYTDGILIAMSGTVAHAVRPPVIDGRDAEKLWTQPNGKFRFGSGVAADKHLFYLSENGIAECWEKNTGRVVWQERLQGPSKKNTSWSSLSKAGNLIYAPNQAGDVFVFAAEPQFRALSTNSVAEPTNASLALAQGVIVLRTDQALWCFGSTSEKG
jgi:outer membrane protein assembly factor BamB